MSSAKQSSDWGRRGLCPGCGKKPKPGLKRCESCLAKQRDYDKKWRMTHQEKGGEVEPQCKPSKGPMRPEHTWDEDGICEACGAKQTPLTVLPKAGPLVPAKPKRTGLDDGPLLPRARPGKGARHKPSDEHRAAFVGAASVMVESKADVATIPDPLAAVLAGLELERDELEIAIATLKRLEARKATARTAGA